MLLPEERVRQWFVAVLHDCGVESYRIATEYSVEVSGRRLRVDIAIFERGTTRIVAIVECKAPSVAISEATLRQAATYNAVVGARYIVVTNGAQNYVYDCDLEAFIDHLPANL